MAQVKFRVFEWKIENFSGWCQVVHGKCIASPDFFSLLEKVELYPKGGSGQDDHMNVLFCNVTTSSLSCELSFIGFDGSSIFSQQLNITHQTYERVPGPSLDLKFEEVVSRIGNVKDEITLRFCFRSCTDYEQLMCTTLGVWNASFKIDPTLVERYESNESKEIAYFRYTSKGGKGICIKSARRQGERLQLIMQPYNKEGKSVLVESSISMLSSDNALVRNEVNEHVFLGGEAWTFSESLTMKELEEKGVTILLQLKVVNGEIVERYNYNTKDEKVRIVKNNGVPCLTEQVPSTSTASSSDDSADVLKTDLMCLYRDQDFSDFTLNCDSVSFPVHKNILSARSPVFKTMLSTDMTEAASGTVDIGDLDPSTLGQFLAFLYTGAVDELQCDGALNLYYAADKYQVPSLKGECTRILSANVSIENVCDVLTLADKHKDDDLLAASRDFILHNYNDVLGSKSWENFMESEPMLAVKTLTHFAKKNYVGEKAYPLGSK